MNYTVTRSDRTTIVALAGSLGFNDHPAFRHVIGTMLEPPGDVVFELSELEKIDAAGLGLLMIACDEVGRTGGKMVMRGARDHVDRVLRTVRMAHLCQRA
jgi:anti-anti-sigma factor